MWQSRSLHSSEWNRWQTFDTWVAKDIDAMESMEAEMRHRVGKKTRYFGGFLGPGEMDRSTVLKI